MVVAIEEVADAQRAWRWVLSRAVSAFLRTVRDRPGRAVLKLLGLVLVALLVLSFVVRDFPVGAVVFVVGLAIRLAAGWIPVIRRLARGRVWEAWQTAPAGSAVLLGWAVATPHVMDRDTWRLDVVPHPSRKPHPVWVEPILTQVHAAADLLGVAVESMDAADRPILLSHGYLDYATPTAPQPILLRPARLSGAADPASASLRQARSYLADRPYDLTALARLTDEIFRLAPAVDASGWQLDWREAVLRRRGAEWEMARACAACLDGHIENLAIGRLDPASMPGGDRQLDEVIERCRVQLWLVAARLRHIIGQAHHDFGRAGGRPLAWAQDLAHLEIDGLLLAGLVASARRGTGASLGILDPRLIDDVREAAVLVRNAGRRLARRAWFDSDKVSWWALAVAGDALDLCRQRTARFMLARAIRKVEANELRYRVVSPVQPRGPGRGDDVTPRLEQLWTKLSTTSRLPPARRSNLAALSATRMRRIGVTRGAEGLRAKRYRRAIGSLAGNLALALFIGVVAWLVTVVLVHAQWSEVTGRTYCLLDQVIGEECPTQAPAAVDFDLGVSPDLALTATLGLLAVVITAAVAVAVATPRESSITAWSQDRAWQSFIVAIGYVASTAGLVLALAPLPQWQALSVPDGRARALGALLIAVLTAASAVSMSALKSRLDAWHQRRRLALADARLRRAHERLGPAPSAPALLGRAAVCLVLCLTGMWSLLLLVLLIPGSDPVSESASEFFVLLGELIVRVYLPPLVALGLVAVIRWLAAWGLASRLATALGIVLAGLLVGLVAVLADAAAALSDSTVGKALWICWFLSPIVLFAAFLVVARINAFRPRGRTGPATFALHLALLRGRHNARRAAD